jgi:hypothetical protein
LLGLHNTLKIGHEIATKDSQGTFVIVGSGNAGDESLNDSNTFACRKDHGRNSYADWN